MTKIFTIGYGGRKPDEFVELLVQKGVKTIVDVRLSPDKAYCSFYKKTKSEEKGIQNLLATRGIKYTSLVELGNVFLEYPDWQKRYTGFLGRTGDLLFTRLNDIIIDEPCCLLCAEKRVADCHRLQIANHLHSQYGYEVEHIE